MIPQNKGINRPKCIAGITRSYLFHNPEILIARINPPQCCATDEDPPKVPNQGQDVAMADAVGDSAPGEGQKQDDQSDQEPLHSSEAQGPSQQEARRNR